MLANYLIGSILAFGSCFKAYQFFTTFGNLGRSLDLFAVFCVYFVLSGHTFNAIYREAKRKYRQKTGRDGSPKSYTIPVALKFKCWGKSALIIILSGSLVFSWFSWKKDRTGKKVHQLMERYERSRSYINGPKKVTFSFPENNQSRSRLN